MVRRMEASDLDCVMQIWLETNKKAHSFIPQEYWKKNFASVKEMIWEAQVYVYEAESSGTIKGFLGLTDNYIAGIFVCGPAQSNGIGKQLLCHAKSLMNSLSLHVYRKNERAVRFYQREGFLCRDERTDLETGEAELLMEWERSGKGA